MDILNLVVPLVGIVGAFLLAILAFKQRTLLSFFGSGLDQAKALSGLPASKRLQGLEIIENTLKIHPIDPENLTAEQKYNLMLQTLKEKTKIANLKFIAYMAFSLFTAICALLFVYFKVFYDPQTKIEDAMLQDRETASQVLTRFYYYEKSDPRLVDALAEETAFGPPGESSYRKLAAKLCISADSKTCNQAIAEIRKRAENREPPFNDVGIPVTFGVPKLEDQPERFSVFVNPKFQYAKKIIEVSNRGKRIVVFASPRLGENTDVNYIHLNADQVNLFGLPFANLDKDRNLNQSFQSTAFVVEVRDEMPELFDASCTNKTRSRVGKLLCGKGRTISTSDYFVILRSKG